MKKQSLSVKIIAGIAVMFLLGCAVFLVAAMCATGGYLAVGFFLVLVGVFGGIALIVGPIFSEWCGGGASRQVFCPGNKNFRDMPPEYSHIHAKIAREDIDGALDGLKDLLNENPRNPYALALISDIYIDKTKDYQNAADLLLGYLDVPERRDEDLQFLMKLTDVYLEVNEDDKAVEFLQAELEKKYSAKVKGKIQKRMNGIKLQN